MDKAILEKYGQTHLLAFEQELSAEQRAGLYEQIERIDFEKMKQLYEKARGSEAADGDAGEYSTMAACDLDRMTENERIAHTKKGEEIIKHGQFAAVTMAGGQGTRLGHNGPKGTYDIGLSNHWTLFRIQCERLKETSEKLGRYIPWYIMTSRENDDDTRNYFENNDYFGYPKTEIRFFIQNMLPMVDFDGKIVMDRKDHIKEGADGHGGFFGALNTSGCFEDMKKRGIKWLFVGGIDNVLLRLCDAEFIGFADNSGMEIASKVVVKRDAKEGVGVFCKKNGRPYVIEYTEISREMAEAKNNDGEWLYGDGHILCNIFSFEAVKNIIENGGGLPYHPARKKTDIIEGDGNIIKPENPNAFKFEAFIFDAFTLFDNIALLRVKRELEFAPVKNREGNDSPETAKAMYEAVFGK